MKSLPYYFMDRTAVFVDAGYLFAQGSKLITGEKLPRGEFILDIKKVVACLEKLASKETKAPLLRIYWYDGTSTGPNQQHVALALYHNVKVRLGFVNAVGEQKGVDSLIVTDMINLARNRAISDAVLLSGDEDLRVGVQQAQEFGVRVHLIGVESHSSAPYLNSQSQFLKQESDTTYMLDIKEVSSFLSRRQKPAPVSPTIEPKLIGSQPIPPETKTVATTISLSEIAKQAASEIDPNVIGGLLENYKSTGRIPVETDRALLGKARRLRGLLNQTETRKLRQDFMDALRSHLPNPIPNKSP